MTLKPAGALVLIAALAVSLTACGSSAPSGSTKASGAAGAAAAAPLFAAACNAVSADDVTTALLTGGAGFGTLVTRVKLALAASKLAAKDDPAYSGFSQKYESFAASLGHYVAVMNAERGKDPIAALNAVSKAADKVQMPPTDPGCPKPKPDSDGLPLPKGG